MSGVIEAEAFGVLRHQGMVIVSQLAGRSITQIRKWHYSYEQATTLRALAHIYFGHTSYSRVQQRAVANARRCGLDLQRLAEIEKFVGRVKDGRDHRKLREQLCGMSATNKTFAREAKQLVDKLNGPRPEAERTGFTVRFATLPGCATARMTIDADAHLIKGFHKVATEFARTNSTTIDAVVKEFLFTGHEGTVPDFETITVISLDAAVRVERALGPDVRLTLSDGTVIWAADYVEKIFADHGHAILAHPVEGELNLYRTQRMANKKQRMLAKAESPVCAWPGCYAPADDCQVNHNVLWARGGETNLDNLSMLCAYHNGISIDEARWGRISKVNHESVWFPPDGGPPIRNKHPAAQMGTWYWAGQP